MSWSELTTATKWLKVKDGETVKGVIHGDLYSRKRVWEGGKPQEYDPDKHKEEDAKTEYSVAFYNLGHENNQIMSGSWNLFKHVAELREQWGDDLFKKVIQITRKGNGAQTSYVFTVAGEVDAGLQEAIDSAEQIQVDPNAAPF